jgi:hypothetical protein
MRYGAGEKFYSEPLAREIIAGRSRSTKITCRDMLQHVASERSRERRAESGERRAESGEQRAESGEQRAESRERRAGREVDRI